MAVKIQWSVVIYDLVLYMSSTKLHRKQKRRLTFKAAISRLSYSLSPTEGANMPSKLGDLLTERRKLKGLTLREVEKGTGVSNGYLNLLEQGKIANPSPNILYKLAEFYGVEYTELLEATGYATKGIARRHTEVAFSLRKDEVTPEEVKELKKFLGYLKSKSSK